MADPNKIPPSNVSHVAPSVTTQGTEAQGIHGHSVQAGKAPAGRAKSTLEVIGTAVYEFFASLVRGFVGLFKRNVSSEIDMMVFELVDEMRRARRPYEVLKPGQEIKYKFKTNLDKLSDKQLKKIHADILKLKNAGVVEALEQVENYYTLAAGDKGLSEEAKSFYRDAGAVFADSKEHLNKMQSEVEGKLKEKGCSFEKEKSYEEKNVSQKSINELGDRLISYMESYAVNKEKFSAEFNKDLLQWYKPKGNVKGHIERFREDIPRMKVFLRDENGVQYPLVDPKDPHPALGSGVLLTQWADRQTKRLLNFFGDDEAAFDKGCGYISQTMGNTYNAAINTSEYAPQRLSNGNRFAVKFSQAQIIDNYLVVKKSSKEKGGKVCGVEYVVTNRPRHILNVDEGSPKLVDKENSHYSLSVNLNFDQNMVPISCEGEVDYKIKVLGDL